MKRLFGIAILAVGLLAGGLSFAAEQTVTLSVSGMTCASCPYIVRQSLAAVDGVTAVKVSLSEKTAVVVFDDASGSIADLTAATGNAGFPSRLIGQGG